MSLAAEDPTRSVPVSAAEDSPTLRSLVMHLEKAFNLLPRELASTDRIQLVLSLLLYKRLSDCYQEEREALAHGEVQTSRYRQRLRHVISIPVGCSWSDVCRGTGDRRNLLNKALAALEFENPCLRTIFPRQTLMDPERLPTPVLDPFLAHLSSVRLRRSDVPTSVLGDACELFRERLADTEVRRKEGFFTPVGVARLMVALLDPQEGMRIYDPFCNSARFLIETIRYLEHNRKDPRSLKLFGREWTGVTTRISLLLYDVSDAPPEPPEETNTRLFHFDRVIGNPPFRSSGDNRNWCKSIHDKLFPRGALCAPTPQISLAFLEHMLQVLAPDGRMCAIMPPSALFAHGAAAKLREHMFGRDNLEAVIDLGSKLFFGTDARAVLLLVRNDKPADRRGKILLVDGAKVVECRGGRNHLDERGKARILAVVRDFGEESDFSVVVESSRLPDGLHLSRFFHTDSPSRRRAKRGAPEPVLPARSALADAQKILERAREEFHRRAHELLTVGPYNASDEHPELGPYPRGWRLVRLEELGELKNGPNLRMNSDRGDSKGTQARRTPIRLISQEALDLDGFVRFESESARRVTCPDHVFESHRIIPGDILLRRVHDSRPGTGALVTRDVPAAIPASGIIRLRVHGDKIDPLVLYCWLHHEPVQQCLSRLRSEGVQNSISQRALRALWYPLIPDPDHRRVAEELRVRYEAVVSAARRLAALRTGPGADGRQALKRS